MKILKMTRNNNRRIIKKSLFRLAAEERYDPYFFLKATCFGPTLTTSSGMMTSSKPMLRVCSVWHQSCSFRCRNPSITMGIQL